MPKGNKHTSAIASSSAKCPHCAGTVVHADTPNARNACKERMNANPSLKAAADARKKELAKNARQVGGNSNTQSSARRW